MITLSIIVRFNLVVRAKNHLFIMLPVEHTSQISQCLLKTIAHVQFPGIHTSHAQNKPCEPSSRTMLVVGLYWCFFKCCCRKNGNIQNVSLYIMMLFVVSVYAIFTNQMQHHRHIFVKNTNPSVCKMVDFTCSLQLLYKRAMIT